MRNRPSEEETNITSDWIFKSCTLLDICTILHHYFLLPISISSELIRFQCHIYCKFPVLKQSFWKQNWEFIMGIMIQLCNEMVSWILTFSLLIKWVCGKGWPDELNIFVHSQPIKQIMFLFLFFSTLAFKPIINYIHQIVNLLFCLFFS